MRAVAALATLLALAGAATPLVARGQEQDPRVALASEILLKTCFGGSVTTEQSGAILEALGASRMPGGSRRTMWHYQLDAGEPIGLVLVALEGTYCMASFASDDIDAGAIARDIHSRLEPDGAVRSDDPGPVGVPPDKLAGAWEIPIGSGANALVIRAFVYASPAERGPRMVGFGRFIVPVTPPGPPPTEPAAVDAPAGAAASRP